jgi:hypothetical protein
MTTYAAQLLGAFAGSVAPPAPPEPLASWAARTLQVPNETNPDEPPRRLDPHPAHQAFWQAYDAGYTELALAGPVQDGKTVAGLIAPLLYQLCVDRRPVALAAPRIEDIADIHRAKLLPVARASGLDILPEQGKGSSGGVPESILANTGTRLYYRGTGGSNEAQLASFTCRAVLITEVDSIAISTRNARRRTAGGDGRRKIDLLRQRIARAQHDGRLILESTIKLDQGSLILDYWESGTAGLLWHRCPFCDAWARRSWEYVSYDATNDHTARATARYTCQACGSQLTSTELQESATGAIDVHKGQQIERGRLVGEIEPSNRWSLLWASLDSPLRRLDWLTVLHRQAVHARDEKDNHEPLRQFTRDHLARGYRSGQERALGRADTRALADRSRASSYQRGMCPLSPDAVAVLIGDHQLREIYHLTLALDDERIAICDAGVEYLCHKLDTPAPGRRGEICDQIHRRALGGLVRATGAVHPIQAGAHDVGGGGWLSELDAWIARHPGWYATRGDTREKDKTPARLVEGAAIAAEPGWWTLFLRPDGRALIVADADKIKERIVRGLALPPDHPCAVLLFSGLGEHDWLLRHLTAEEQREEKDGTLVWHQIKPRNDWFDAAVYAVALARYLRYIAHQPADPAADFLAAITGA